MINKYTESYFLHSLCAVLCTSRYTIVLSLGFRRKNAKPLDKRKKLKNVRSELQLCEFALR